MKIINCIACFVVKSDKLESLIEHMTKFLNEAKTLEKGLLKFELYKNLSDNREVKLLLTFDNIENYKKHFQTDYLKKFVDNVLKECTEKVEHCLYDLVLGG